MANIQELEQELAALKALFHRFVHGDENTDVVNEAGTYPSFAKAGKAAFEQAASENSATVTSILQRLDALETGSTVTKPLAPTVVISNETYNGYSITVTGQSGAAVAVYINNTLFDTGYSGETFVVTGVPQLTNYSVTATQTVDGVASNQSTAITASTTAVPNVAHTVVGVTDTTIDLSFSGLITGASINVTVGGSTTTITGNTYQITGQTAESIVNISYTQTVNGQTSSSTPFSVTMDAATPLIPSLRSAIESLSPVSALNDQILVRKLRDDYNEFVVYTPLSDDGIEWTRWLFSSRFNGGATLPEEIGATRMILASKSSLYAANEYSAPDDNRSSEALAKPSVSQLTTVDALSRSGTWTASATIGTTTDVTRTELVGDYVEYELNAVSDVLIRSYVHGGNGGVVRVEITSGGVAIDSQYYCCTYDGTNYVVDQSVTGAQASGNGTQLIPVARNLPVGDYIVRLTLDSTTGSSTRLYDAGILGFSSIEYDEVGFHGMFTSTSISPVAQYPGSVFITSVTGSRLALKLGYGNAAGIISYTVYDSSGAEIPSQNYSFSGREIDLYEAKILYEKTVVVADNLDYGEYYIKVTLLPSKNENSSYYRLYTAGAIAYDLSSAGVLGTNTFDDSGVQDNLGNLQNDIPDNSTFITGGNIETAIDLRKTTDAVGSEEFVGGVHKYETTPTNLTFTSEGLDFGYEAAQEGSEFILTSLDVSFDSQLYFYGTSDLAASVNWNLNLSRNGYTPTITRVLQSNAYVYHDYVNMLMFPKSSDSAAQFGNKGVLGGFPKLYAEGIGMYEFSVDENSGDFVSGATGDAACFNSGYTVVSMMDNYISPYTYEGNVDLASINNRLDGAMKYYYRGLSFDNPDGFLLNAGDTHTFTKTFRVIDQSISDIYE